MILAHFQQYWAKTSDGAGLTYISYGHSPIQPFNRTSLNYSK